MKKLFFLLLAFTLTTAVVTAQNEVVPAAKVGGPVMEFTQTEMDYGTIDKGSDPLRVFTFKNTGTEALVIQGAKGSCGCTVPSYPKEPILPGATSQIEVRYDTQREGAFQKTVTLTTNETTNTRVLTIKGTVKPAAAVPEGVPVSQPSILGTTPKN